MATRLKRCKICKTLLSSYNSEPYCFIHHRAGQLIEDARKDKLMYKDKHIRQRERYQKEKRNGHNA